MSNEAMNAVWHHSKARGSERLVLLAIADSVNSEEGVCWPSVNHLAVKTNLGRRYVQKIIERLCLLGELVVVHRMDATKQLNQSNLYRVNLPGVVNYRPRPPRQKSPAPGRQPSPANEEEAPTSPPVEVEPEPQAQPLPAQPAPPYLAQFEDEAALLRIFTAVTGMVVFPSREREAAIVTLQGLLRHTSRPEALQTYLKPFFGEWRARKYNPANLGWLTDWAVGGEIPPRHSGKPPGPPGRQSTVQRSMEAIARVMGESTAADIFDVDPV